MQREPVPWNRLLRSCADFSVLLLLWIISARLAFGQSSEWNVGTTIGLRAGACIREGPGLNYRAHTRVPEDNWTVMVIDGPRQATGKTWYDTSRKAAGDPSGGTGWVAADWSDRDCGLPATASKPPASATPGIPVARIPSDLLDYLRSWWSTQSSATKWVVALVAVTLLILMWRRVGSHLISLVLAIIGTLLIVWLMDITREAWQGPWQSLVGSDAPDLALLVGAIPLVSWLLGLLRRGRAN